MIDFYRKSFLAQLGKDAGNQSMSEYTRNIITNYDKYLSKAKDQRTKPQTNKSGDFELYL